MITPRPSFIAYVVVDTATTPPTPVGVELSSRAARERIEHSEEPDQLRIRRARVTLFQS